VLSQEVDKHLYSPLHCASVNGRAECLEALLARATPRQACATQWLRRTVLHLGALSGHAEVVAALLESPGVNPNSEDGDGRSPLFAAAMVGSADCVALLLDAGCNTEKDDMHAQTPAFVAAENGFVQVLKVRPKQTRGALLRRRLRRWSPCLTVICIANFTQVLSDAGANLDKPDQRGLTPTHIAAAKGARNHPDDPSRSPPWSNESTGCGHSSHDATNT